MFLKTIIISVILVAIVMLALGVKLLFDKKQRLQPTLVRWMMAN